MEFIDTCYKTWRIVWSISR